MKINIFKFWFLAALVVVAGLAGCEREPPRDQDVIEIRKLMEQRKQAIENQDIELYSSLIYDGYTDVRSNKKDLVADMESAFKRYKSISFTYQRSPIEFKMNTARVIQRIIYHVDDTNESYHDHEITLLRQVDGKWYISGGVRSGAIR
jgi:hypothetical protein